MITANYTTLMSQAPATIMTYVRDLESQLDAHWGEGWCQATPQAFAMLVQATSWDFNSAALIIALQEIAAAL